MFVFFGGLLVLALFAALIGPHFIDWSSYRQDFEREAGRLLGQKVQVLGKADARLLPFPSVSFDNVIVGEGQDGRPMMTIEQFSMDVELAPFLSGEVRIFDMRINNPRGTLRLSSEGELDWALRNEKNLPGQALTLESITITNGQVLIIDEQSERQHLITDLDVKMSAKSIAGPWLMEGSGEIDGYRGDFEFQTGTQLEENRIRLKTRLLPAALPVSVDLEGDLRIENLKPQYKGTFEVRALDPATTPNANGTEGKSGRHPLYARALGIFELNNERLRIEDYRLETGDQSDPYVISGQATLDTGRNPEFLLIADGQQLNLSRMGDSQDGTQDEAQTDDPVSLDERLETLRQLVAVTPVPQMPGRVSVSLPAVLAGNTTIRDVLMEAEPDGVFWKINRIEAKFPGRTQFLAAGQMGVGANLGFTGEVIVASNQPSGFASWLTDSVDPAIRRLDAAGLSARVDLSPQLQRFDELEIAVGPATLKGRLERVVPIQGRPSLSLVLDGEEVDADALRALAGLVVGKNRENRLAEHDVSARLSTERFRASDVVANGTDLSVRLKGGTLDIDRLTVADLAGASISGVGRLDNIFKGPVGDVDISLMTDNSQRLTALLSQLGGRHPVLDHLRTNAGKFGETTIDVQAQFAPGTGDLTTLSSRIRGRTGGSRLNIVVDRQDAFAPLDTGQISVTADLSSNNPRNLLSQMGVESLPGDISGAAAVDMRLEGVPAEQLDFSLNYDAPDMLVSARGKGWQDEERNLQGDFRFSLSSDDLTPYLAMNGINVVDPTLPLPVDIEADIKTDAQQFQLGNLSGKAAGADFSGDVRVTRNTEIADIKGAVALSEIDLAWIAELMVGPGTVLSGGESWSPAEFLPPLQNNLEFDLDLEAQSAQLHVGPATGPFAGKIVLKDNELQLRDMQADWQGGSLSGAITLANRDSSALVSGQLQLRDADLQPFMWARSGLPVARGKFNLSASFEGAGRSVRDVVGSLSGSGIIDMDDLELDGLENESLTAILASADADGFELESENIKQLVDRVTSSGKFHAGEVSVPFTMAAGVLRMPNIVLSDTSATVRGEARLNLVDEDINARFDVEFDPEENALTGAAPAISIGFLGPVRAPERSLEVGALSNFLSLRAFERERRRVEILQAVVLENQRMRREALLAKQEARNHRQAAIERKRLEAERFVRERERRERERIARLEAEQREKEEAETERLRAEEAARQLEEEARRVEAEEKARLLDEAQARAAQQFADRLARGEAAPPSLEDDFIRQLEDAVRQAGEGDPEQGENRRKLPQLKFNFETFSE